MLNYKYIKEQAELDSVLGWLNERRFIVVDSETTGIDPFRSKLVTLQLGDKEQQYVIDARRVNLVPLKPVMEDPAVIKVGQNLKFDWQLFYIILGWSLNSMHDTMIADQVLR